MKKRAAIAILLIIALLLPLLAGLRKEGVVYAQDSFYGIESIVDNNSSANRYTILEIVPDSKAAKIGYLIENEEPLEWMGALEKLVGKEARAAYMEDLKSGRFATLIAAGVFSGSEYRESYVAKDGYTQVNLAAMERIEAGTSGYEMVSAGGGAYVLTEDFTLQKNGGFSQNADYYVKGGNSPYYNVRFTALEVKAEQESKEEQAGGEEQGTEANQESGEEQAGEAGQENKEEQENKADEAGPLYTAKSATVLKSDNINDFSGNEYYYSYDKDTKTYTPEKRLSEADQTLVTGGGYYIVEFAYAAKADDKDAVYYRATAEFSYDFENNQATGVYSAVLNANRPYIEDARGNFQTSGKYYHLVGSGGSYRLAASDNAALGYPAEIQTIYVDSGLKNNNLFANGVFNQSGEVTKELYFEVRTMPAKDVTGDDVAKADLIYLSASSSLEDYDGGYSTSNDLAEGVASAIFARAAKSTNVAPVIVDAGLLKETNLYIGTLAAVLANDSDNFGNISDLDNVGSLTYTVDENGDGHYVNANIYVIPSDTAGACPYLLADFAKEFISGDNENEFHEHAKAEGFGEVAGYINSENTFRTTQQTEGESGANLFDLKISKAIAVEYIIGYASKRTITINPNLTVLDIEPCYPEDLAKQEEAVSKMIDDAIKDRIDSSYTITVEVMSTAQYIGDINDLSRYDIIYFGDYIGRFNTSNGKTVYNDTSMNGLIYSNIGDKVGAKYCLAGMFETDYTKTNNKKKVNTASDTAKTYRYSGNDITEMKKKELEEFAQAGYPIIVASTYLKTSSGKISGINTERVDCNSKIYELFHALMVSSGKKANVMSKEELEADSAKLIRYLQMGSPSLEIISDAPLDKVVELSSHRLSLQFKITNWGAADLDASFDVALYLDANADGKFSRTEEKISGGDLIVMNGNTTLDPDRAGHYALTSNRGVVYDLYYQLPDEYVGFVPWKLIISQNGNDYRYASQTGFFHRRASEPEEIKVLQIRRAGGYGDETFNLEKNDKFKSLIQSSEVASDFKISVSSKTQAELIAALKYGTADEWYNYFNNNYDMLILGFSDCYMINDTNAMVQGLEKYIKEGKSVLFTHDCTSFWNITAGVKTNSTDVNWGNTIYWGYDFNKYIRGIVGMDRYGVSENADASVSDAAYEPKSQNKKDKYIQGYTIGTLNSNYTNSKEYHGFSGNPLGRGDATAAQQVNAGQITKYPFQISDTLTISKTHTQYYQLNLNLDADEDGESDLVVWYTLADNTQGSILNCSPKDVRNSYYIYTMGNITYSGVGHSAVNSEEEIKLYINTIVAAHSARLQAPASAFKEGSKASSKERTVLYLTTDDQLATEDANHTYIENDLGLAFETVWFHLQDNNLVRNLKEKNITIGFYVSSTAEEYNANHSASPDEYTSYVDDTGTAVYMKKASGIKVFDKNGTELTDWTKLSNGMYYAEIPYNVIQSTEDIYLRSMTTISYSTDKTDTTTPYSTDVLKVQRNRLFNLD